MAHIILTIGWIVFGLIHSIMASRSFKKIMLSWVFKKPAQYRIFYNLVALITFFLLLYYQFQIEKISFWRPSLVTTLLGGGLTGIGIGVGWAALKQYDLLEFTGLELFGSGNQARGTLKTTGLSGWVRHPLYTGTLLVLWGLWLMDATLSSFLMAACLTVYIRVGIIFEEKKLLREFGDRYASYQQRVPMLFPSLL